MDRVAGEDTMACSGWHLRKTPYGKTWQPDMLNSCPFSFPKSPFVSSKHTTENCYFFPRGFPNWKYVWEMHLTRSIWSAPVYMHYPFPGHPSNVPVGFPNNTLLLFEGTVQNFTETDYLQERGLICWCSSSHKDIRLSQLSSPVVSGCWQDEIVKLFITVSRVPTSLSFVRRCHSAKLLTPVIPPWKNSP